MPFPRATPALAAGPERVDAPRFRLTHSLGLALLLHLLILLLISLFPELFAAPEVRLARLRNVPASIKFTFIDVPDDHVVAENPDAKLVSDKAREESGPTPQVTTPEGRHPPSTGNTREKIAGGAQVAARESRLPPAPRLPRPARPAAAAREPAGEPAGRRRVDTDRGPGPRDLSPRAAPGKPSRRPDGRQRRFSHALDRLAADPLPLDLEAMARPADTAPDPGAGRSTVWNFDNPNPSFPVKIGTLSFDSKGADFGPWLAEFHSRVLNEWNRNLTAWHERVWQDMLGARVASDSEIWNRYARIMNRTRGVTGVDFLVTREGSVVNLQMIHPSGALELDRSVQKTLRNVLLPPLPDDYPDDTLLIRAGFYYNVEPPE